MLSFLLALSFFSLSSAANVTLAPLFSGDSVILQASVPARIWGNATPGSSVRLLLDGAPTGTASADAAGRWEALLPPQPPSWRVLSLAVEDAAGGGGAPALAALRFGLVLLCSGQSKWVTARAPPLPRGARAAPRNTPRSPPPPPHTHTHNTPAAWT